MTLAAIKNTYLANPGVELALQLASNLLNLCVVQPISAHPLRHEQTASVHLFPDRVRGHISRGQGNQKLAGHLLGHVVGDTHLATPPFESSCSTKSPNSPMPRILEIT